MSDFWHDRPVGTIVLGSMLLAASVAGASADAPPVVADALFTRPLFRTLGTTDGLPSSSVWKLAQDRDGYIWIGTADGLARYDGVGFRVFRHAANDPGSLSADDVTALFVDRDNRLWCGGEDAGLNLFDAQAQTFRHFRHDANVADSLGGVDVWAIGQDAGGAIWVGAYAAGLDRYDESRGGFVHFRHSATDADSIGSDNVLALRGDRTGSLWIGTDAGIDVRGADGHFRHVGLAGVPGGGGINAAVFAETDGGMLVGTRRGLLRVGADLKAELVEAERLPDKVVYGVATDAKGGIWIATRDGLAQRRANGKMEIYTENPTLPGSLPARKLFDLLRDREGGLWIATTDAGLAYLAPNWRNFAAFRHDPADPLSLSDNRVQGLAADAQGWVWVVNREGGIDHVDPVRGSVERFAAHGSVPGKALWSVLADRGGRLWVGHTLGLRVYALPSGQFRDVPVDPRRHDALGSGAVDLLVEGADAVWASASGSGVHRIDPQTLSVERFDAADGLRSGDVGQIGLAPDGAMLAAHAAGLDRFDASARRFTPVRGAPTQRVLAFAFVADGSLWLHLPGELAHYRFADGALTPLEQFASADGWPSLTAGGMQADAAGNLWVSSTRGLWRIDPKSRAIRRFGTGDGLASAEFSRQPLLRTPDGRLFGGTLAGIVGFDPARIVENAALPPPLLDAISVRRGGRDLVLDMASRDIALRWNDRDLRLAARAPAFANPALQHYQSRLRRFDRDWIDAGTRGEREFSQLPPGDYQLQLRVAGADGVWSAPATPLRLRVAPPPWATAWAYAAYAATCALAIVVAFRAYRARMRRRHRLELAEQQRQFAESASAAKSEFLATMGHEIRTPMTGVLGMTELLLRTPLDGAQRGYAEAIQTSGQMMLRLLNDSLDLARIEAGKLELESKSLDLHALVRAIAALAEPLAHAKALGWTLTLAEDAPRHVLGDSVRIQQIVLNLVNNAIKFTAAGSVTLAFSRALDGAARIEVRDTGPGIPAAAQARLFRRFEQADGPQRQAGSGLGLAICRELAARMGGEITLNSAPGQGSRFTVNLPLTEVAAPGLATTQATSSAATPKRILLVEDDATVAATISGLLAADGHTVRHAENALAALSGLTSAPHDAALVDLDLPGVDGLTLAGMIRAHESHSAKPRLPLVGISARSVGDEEAQCLAAGMDAFVRKPLTRQALDEVLSRVVESVR